MAGTASSDTANAGQGPMPTNAITTRGQGRDSGEDRRLQVTAIVVVGQAPKVGVDLFTGHSIGYLPASERGAGPNHSSGST